MNFGRWNRKKFIISGAVLLLVLILITSGARNYEIDTMIYNTKPEEVWEFMADFSKIRILNPLILSFRIISDSGHAHDWRYTVEYWERISHWPYWFNKATAEYIIKKPMPGVKNQNYTIESKHTTCFFKGFYCLSSLSEFTCRAHDAHAHCAERIVYQCPPLLSMLCRRELEHQRKTVMDNLTAIFSKEP